MQIAGMILTQALVLQRTNHIELIWQHLRRTAGSGDWHPLAAALEEWLESLSILHENQGRSQAAPLAASRQRTRCRDRPQPQRTSRILRDSYHSGTDAARGCQSPLPASLPLAPLSSKKFQKNPPPKPNLYRRCSKKSKSYRFLFRNQRLPRFFLYTFFESFCSILPACGVFKVKGG